MKSAGPVPGKETGHNTTVRKPIKLHSHGIAELAGKTSTQAGWSR